MTTSNRHSPIRSAYVLSILTLAFVGAFGWVTHSSFNEIRDVNASLVQVSQLRGKILKIDETLTMSARLGSASGDVAWEQRYKNAVPLLEKALGDMEAVAPDEMMAAANAKTSDANNRLIAMEEESFSMAKDGNASQGYALLVGPAYTEQKSIYAEGMTELHSGLVAHFEKARDEVQQNATNWAVADGVLFGLLLFAWGNVIRSMKRSQDALEAANTNLESQVIERTRVTADLALAHSEEREARETLEITQAELVAQSTLLEASNRDLQDFASVAAHDLQEPIRKIQAFGERIERKFATEIPPKAMDDLSRMRAAAKRMSALISDILNISRLRGEHKTGSVELAVLVAGVVDELRSELDTAGSQIEIGDLPVVEGDASQLRQLVANLLGNASKYRREGVPLAVRIDCKHVVTGTAHSGAAEAYEITFRDNGIGFAQEHAEKIFTIFQRLHGSSEYEGTGVGLALCRNIVDRHGGTIVAHGVPNEGASFVITLPATAYKKNAA